MLVAAMNRKGRRGLKLFEDEITSVILGPLAYMPVQDVWKLFQVWLPFKDISCCLSHPVDVEFDFWPNLKKVGRIEPDLRVRFIGSDKETVLILLFEVKWNSGISGKDELINQWNALSELDRKNAFHVYLVKNTPLGAKELKDSLARYDSKTWEERLVCIGWYSLIETLHFDRPQFGKTMNIWADGVLAFLQGYGQTVFTGFDWVANTVAVIDDVRGVFWQPTPWFSGIDRKVENSSSNLFWSGLDFKKGAKE